MFLVQTNNCLVKLVVQIPKYMILCTLDCHPDHPPKI